MARSSFRRLVAKVAVGALAVAVPVALVPTAAQAASTDLFLSEYIEGSSFNKAVEIYNGTGAAVDLSGGGYRLELYSNGSATVSQSLPLSGVLDSGEVFVAAHPSANATILAVADVTSSTTVNWNGDDAVVLRKGGEAGSVVDAIGQVGFDPGSEWGTGLTSTADNTLRRKATIEAGDANPGDVFDPSVEWDGYATNDTDGLGAHPGLRPDAAPTVGSVTPADGTTAAASVSPTVTFSEPVNLAAGAISLSCSISTVLTATLTGGPTTFTVDPDTNLVDGDVCTLSVLAASVTDEDTNDPPDSMLADFSSSFTVADTCTATATPIYDIQGSGAAAAITGPVVTRGVVVADYEGASPTLRGFYLQDATGDGDAATSDGIFVFNGINNSVALGDVVTVTGTAAEFQDQTQVSASTVAVCGTGTVPAPTAVSLPVASSTELEKYEGMHVTFPQTLYVTEHFQLGRFGQVVVSSGGRLQQPTNVLSPGVDEDQNGVDDVLDLQAANNLNRLIIDDTLNNQNPDPIIWGRGDQDLSASNTLRGGDTTTNATGILTYTWSGNAASGNAYRLRPLDQSGDGVTFTAANPRPTAPSEVGGDVKAASMNLLNYFNTFDGVPDNVDNCTFGVGGAPADCRGADTQAEFDRQWPKTVAAIAKVDADVIGVNEIENDGYGPDSAIAHLVDRLNATLGSGTYAYIDVDAATGEINALGTDAIKVGMLYKPAAVTPIGDTAALNTVEFVNGGDGDPRSRPSLAQAFEVNATGGIFVADVNHLKSKGSACDEPAVNDGQGNCNDVRTNSALELAEWLASDPTGTGDTDVLILGDLNSYAKEDPIVALEDAGYTNLVSDYLGPDAYSYVFDGQWGYLDHALASATMRTQVDGVAEYHIDADEPSVLDYNTDFKSLNLQDVLYAPDEFRVSDHDPVIVGLSPEPTLDTTGFEGPLATDGRVFKAGSTIPVKLTLTAADGSVPDDLTVVVTIRLGGQVVATGTARFVDGYWEYLVRSGDLPNRSATYSVTAHVLDNGQTVTGSFRLRP